MKAYERDSYLIQAETPLLAQEKQKEILKESVRGDDIYLMVDVCNYSLTYSLCGQTNHMSPDDPFSGFKTCDCSIAGKASPCQCYYAVPYVSTPSINVPDVNLLTVHLHFRN